jgi:hypothetical protein
MTTRQELPSRVEDFHLREWDKGIFALELNQLSLFPRALPADGVADNNPESLMTGIDIPDPIEKGTFHGTALALTEMYDRIEQRCVVFLLK